MTTVEYFERHKSDLNCRLRKRIDEINTYSFDTEHNWRLSDIQKLSEEIQHYTNVICELRKRDDEE